MNLAEFIMQHRDRFNDRHNNMFSFSFGEIDRYLRYLEIVYDRYVIASNNLVTHVRFEFNSIKENSKTTVSNTQMIKTSKMHDLLNLEIETFYLLAKILLDK